MPLQPKVETLNDLTIHHVLASLRIDGTTSATVNEIADSSVPSPLAEFSGCMSQSYQTMSFETELILSRPYIRTFYQVQEDQSILTMISGTTFDGGSRARSRSVLQEQLSL